MTSLSHLNDYTIVFVNKRTKSNAEYFRTPGKKIRHFLKENGAYR